MIELILARTARRWIILGSAAAAVVGLPLLLSMGEVGGGRAEAQQNGTLSVEVQRYLQALERICEGYVTAELVRLHQDAVRALEAAKYGGGRDSNFWGVRTSEHAWLDCFQADGERE